MTIDEIYGRGTQAKMDRVLLRFTRSSTVWLISLHTDGTTQVVYVIVPDHQTAVRLAKEHSELTDPKLRTAHKHLLGDLEPAEIADFSDSGIAVFEPEPEE